MGNGAKTAPRAGRDKSCTRLCSVLELRLKHFGFFQYPAVGQIKGILVLNPMSIKLILCVCRQTKILYLRDRYVVNLTEFLKTFFSKKKYLFYVFLDREGILNGIFFIYIFEFSNYYYYFQGIPYFI